MLPFDTVFIYTKKNHNHNTQRAFFGRVARVFFWSFFLILFAFVRSNLFLCFFMFDRFYI